MADLVIYVIMLEALIGCRRYKLLLIIHSADSHVFVPDPLSLCIIYSIVHCTIACSCSVLNRGDHVYERSRRETSKAYLTAIMTILRSFLQSQAVSSWLTVSSGTLHLFRCWLCMLLCLFMFIICVCWGPLVLSHQIFDPAFCTNPQLYRYRPHWSQATVYL